MPYQSLARFVAPLGLAGLLGAFHPLTASPPSEPWSDLLGLRFSDAAVAFRLQGTEDRRALLGLGLSFLALQPRSMANIHRAEAIFRQLAETGADELAIIAHYYLGRVASVHRDVPDFAEAARYYELAIDADRESLWAHRAFCKLVLVRLIHVPAHDFARLCDQLESRAVLLTRPGYRSEAFRLIAAIGAHRGMSPHDRLRLMLASYRSDPSRLREAPFALELADLAYDTGHNALAREYYDHFLRIHPVHFARSHVQDRLATLPVIGESTPSP